MKNNVTISKPGDVRKTIYGAGDEYAYLATGKQTDGQYFFFEGLIPPGGGPPPHIQTREEEGFYILEGEITFWIEGEKITAPKGTFINVPKGVKHNFKNENRSPGRMLFFFSPAGIEDMFDELVADKSRSSTQEEVTVALNRIGKKYGVEFLKE